MVMVKWVLRYSRCASTVVYVRCSGCSQVLGRVRTTVPWRLRWYTTSRLYSRLRTVLRVRPSTGIITVPWRLRYNTTSRLYRGLRTVLMVLPSTGNTTVPWRLRYNTTLCMYCCLRTVLMLLSSTGSMTVPWWTLRFITILPCACCTSCRCHNLVSCPTPHWMFHSMLVPFALCFFFLSTNKGT